jgi:hypothetical protein
LAVTATRIVWLVRWRDECLDQGGEFGMGGNEVGEEADPAVDAGRVQARGGSGVVGGVAGAPGHDEGDREVELRMCQGLLVQVQAQREFGGRQELPGLARGEQVAEERAELPRIVEGGKNLRFETVPGQGQQRRAELEPGVVGAVRGPLAQQLGGLAAEQRLAILPQELLDRKYSKIAW